MFLVEIVFGVILFCPLVVLVVSFLVFLKMRIKKRFAMGLAADLTTLVLFFSVPLAFETVWGSSYVFILLTVVLCVGLAITFMDWRTKKEIEVPVLFKKIWRMYFLILSMLYIITCIAGLVMNVLHYVSAV